MALTKLHGALTQGVETGTTAQRPSSANAGKLYYNTTDSKLQIYTGNEWASIGPDISFTADTSNITADNAVLKADQTIR
jgi:hypothetical protein